MAIITRTSETRWLRRYRTFFLIGIIILSVQIYLAFKFFTIQAKNVVDLSNVEFNSVRFANFEQSSDEHSARRFADGINVDDEDNAISYKLKQPDKSFKLNETKSISTSTEARKKNLVLRVEELDFTPSCNVTTKEAISAIHRAKTQNCKQILVNVTCRMQSGQLYPETLINECPNRDPHSGRSLGCYQDAKAFRLLNGYYANYKTTNSPEHCIRMCLQSGFVFAGVQYSTECFCGNDEPPTSARLPDPSCNMKCPANPRKACGGYFTINIYRTGISAFSAQQPESTTNAKDKPVRIVYLLTLNGRAVRQVRRLIKALFHQNHYFYIHVDARQDYLFRELLVLEKRFPNIRLARKRYATIWGGASLLQMLLTSMRDLLDMSWNWDFMINLSESDFPVKPGEKLVEFLTANRDKNFVKSHGREVQRFIQKQGLDKTFVECDAHMWRAGDRRLPWGIQIDGGSDWVALNRPFIEFVSRNNSNPLIEGLLTIFKYTLLPAESFFHTALRNSRFCNTYVDNNLHVTNWKRKLGCKCQYKHVVDWCGCSPNDFKIEDWPRILATESKQLYFARKFEPVIDQNVILKLESWLFDTATIKVSNLTNVHQYWQSVYHQADLNPPPDDAVVTIGASLARLAMKKFLCVGERQHHVNLLEISSFHIENMHRGTVVSFNINVENRLKFRFETHVVNSNNLLISNKNHSSLLKRLKAFYVSSEYDQKEQISRNFARMLGPFSEPNLIYEFGTLADSKSLDNITVLWLDPSGEVVDVSTAQIEASYVINNLKLGLKPPLLPGVWTVKMLGNKNLLAQSKFLVSPLEFLSKMPISLTQARITHSGSVLGSHAEVGDWERFAKPINERTILKSLIVANSRRVGKDLREWIDSLVNKFYEIQGICLKKNATDSNRDQLLQCPENHINSCSTTNWSTFAPDPKSEIHNLTELR